MMLGLEQLTFQMRLAAIVLPVALYFLVLGLLNSRRHPHMLTSRQDFVLLMATLSPLLLVPAMGMLHGPWAVAVAAAVLGGLGTLLLTDHRDGQWVIYNLPQEDAFDVMERCLARLGAKTKTVANGLEFFDKSANAHTDGTCMRLEIRPFPMLRNVSLRLRNADPHFTRRFRDELSRQLAAMEAPTTPMAMGLLIVATAMMMAPLAMIVQKAPELVRLLTDLGH
ncbi:MAG: hypothetical protein FWE88_09130 [Phycisphaerae bacterium]|nr:hypothetical protein [Phycisphaerae bacterium]